MSIQIRFGPSNLPEEPTIVLAKRNGDKIGKIDSRSVSVSDHLKDAGEISFKVYKFIDGNKTPLWDDIVDFKLVYCREWNKWFEVKINVDESNETVKTVNCTQLGPAELSQIMLYDVEINTENDIARDDYIKPTVFYDEDDPQNSLLNRLLEKAPHYVVTHVDDSLKKIEKIFSFSDTSIYDAFQKVAEEMDCLFVFPSESDEEDKLRRTIEVYDLENVCEECGYRGNFDEQCPKCGGNHYRSGYGEDTTIYLTSDELADNLQDTGDSESVKNCFKLIAGDDLMTATVVNCNPNGTDTLWRISDAMKAEMSKDLAAKIDAYDRLYSEAYSKREIELNGDLVQKYNDLIDKYSAYSEAYSKIGLPIIGFPSLINAYYDTIDFELFLRNSFMPDVNMADTDARKEAEKLTTENLSPVAVSDIDSLSRSSADSAVLAMAKVIVNSRYKVKIANSSLTDNMWTGSFSLENYSDEEDAATTDLVSVEVNDDYAEFIKQKLDKALNKSDAKDMSIVGLFKKELPDFVEEIKLYSLNGLQGFLNSCQACIDILIEQGLSESTHLLYDEIYLKYVEKKEALEAEIKVREDEIVIIDGRYDSDSELIEDGIQPAIVRVRTEIQDELNFKNYIGEDLWPEFCSFRREDKYENSNYISDGLNNAELIKNANDFFKVAQDEILKASTLQHSITSTLKNLLVIEKFKPIVRYFNVGNWIRVRIDDKIYKLRLVSYSFQYDRLDTIDVEFSDVIEINNSITKLKKSLDSANSMASSYDGVKRQAKRGEEGSKAIDDILKNGIDAANVSIVNDAQNQNQLWGKTGMLFREYDEIADEYTDTQLKIINSTISITTDRWKTSKVAIGKIYYQDPISKEVRQDYGVNADVLVGRILLGEKLGIYNSSNTLSFDENGLDVSGTRNKVVINPNNTSIILVKKGEENILSLDDDGGLAITGKIRATSLELSDNVVISSDKVNGLKAVATSGSYDDLEDKPIFSKVAYSGKYEDVVDAPSASLIYQHTNDIKTNAEKIADLQTLTNELSEQMKDLVTRVEALEAPETSE